MDIWLRMRGLQWRLPVAPVELAMPGSYASPTPAHQFIPLVHVALFDRVATRLPAINALRLPASNTV